MKKTAKTNYLFCPAADSLNKHNETGSIGQLGYEFLKALSRQTNVAITALAMHAYELSSFRTVSIKPLYKGKHKPSGLRSLTFYIHSFIKYRFKSEYTSSKYIQHLMPFSPGISFNLFFIFKNKRKFYILGPILGPHTSLVNLEDEGSNPMWQKMTLRLSSGLLRWLSERTIKNSDLILFADKYSRKTYHDWVPSVAQTAVIGFGVSKDIYKVRPTITSPLSPLRVLFVGRLTERKGCIYLVQALAILKTERPDMAIVCTIIGKGPELQLLQKLVKDNNLKSEVVFRGGFKGNNEINKFYNNNDIICLPALSDTWMSLKEALLCGLPAITTDIASHGEHIKTGFNGLLVPPMNARAIATALITVADNPELRQKFSANAVITAEKNYNWDVMIKKYLKLIERIEHARNI